MHKDPTPGKPIAAGCTGRPARGRKRVVRMVTASSIVIALVAPAHATSPLDGLPPAADYFAGVVQEQDVSLVFSYLREALSAAVTGREPPPAEPLIERADAIGNELAKRGASVGRAVLDAIERAVRENLREAPRLPPGSPPQHFR
ncbi:MAG TPA: hypothetical protein VM164_02070 [Burkholderiales bacterium]|nr:hypothetical protein [Burkholderiales bacterium]